MHVFIVKNGFKRIISVKKDLNSAKNFAINDFKALLSNADFLLEEKLEDNIHILNFNYRCKFNFKTKIVYEIEEHIVD